MKTKLTFTGNLTANAVEKTTSKGVKYFMATVAVNTSKEETLFYTLFCFDISPEFAKYLTQGSLVYVYGDNKETIEENPNSKEKYISRVVTVKDLELLYSKKAETEATPKR